MFTPPAGRPQRYGGPDGLGPGPNVPKGGSGEQRNGIVHVGSFWKSGIVPFNRSRSSSSQIPPPGASLPGKTVSQGLKNWASSRHALIPNWNVIVPLNKSRVPARTRPMKPRFVLFISKLPKYRISHLSNVNSSSYRPSPLNTSEDGIHRHITPICPLRRANSAFSPFEVGVERGGLDRIQGIGTRP